MLDIFGERSIVPEALIYSYVKPVIVSGIQMLQIYLGEELVLSCDYKLQICT